MSAEATVEIRSYCEPMAGENGGTWPDAGRRLLEELAASRGIYALIAGEYSAVDRLVDRLADDLDLQVARIGADLAARGRRPTVADVEAACASATILIDLDALLWPDLGAPILPLLAALARHRPIIAAWPGVIVDRRARYSLQGRPDHHDARLTKVMAIRPRMTRFPDEVPYEIERIAQ